MSEFTGNWHTQLLQKVETVLSECLQEAIAWLKEAKQFTKKQVPLFIGELLSLGRIEYTLYSLAAIVGMLVCFGSATYLAHLAWRSWSPAALILSVGIGILGLDCVKFLGKNAPLMLRAWVAPRLFLIEQLRQFMQTLQSKKG